MPDTQNSGSTDARPPGDAVMSICEYQSNFAMRHCQGPSKCMNWQAGVLRTEYRDYKGPGMMTRFTGHVSLFYLLGNGESRDEAVLMAQRRGKV